MSSLAGPSKGTDKSKRVGNLVLSRKVGESLVYHVQGTDITITMTVIEVIGHRVRLATEAPQNVVVSRKEQEADSVGKPVIMRERKSSTAPIATVQVGKSIK